MATEINSEKIKNIFNQSNFSKFAFRLLLKYSGKLIFLVVIFMFAYVVYIWYYAIYNSNWSDLQKQDYARDKEKGIVFGKSNFETVASDFEARKEEFQKEAEAPEDIFRVKN